MQWEHTIVKVKGLDSPFARKLAEKMTARKKDIVGKGTVYYHKLK
jgi:hypothetical protein